MDDERFRATRPMTTRRTWPAGCFRFPLSHMRDLANPCPCLTPWFRTLRAELP